MQLHEKSLDTKVLLAWNDDTVVLSFRGTASLKNVIAGVPSSRELKLEASHALLWPVVFCRPALQRSKEPLDAHFAQLFAKNKWKDLARSMAIPRQSVALRCPIHLHR